MTSPLPPKKKSFVGVHETAIEKIVALGVAPELLEPLWLEFGKLATDNVTGFHEGRSGDARVSTLEGIIQHVQETGEAAFYVEMDLQNLSGLNAKLGHAEANKIYRRIAAMIAEELSKIASQTVFFRHGGDEMSAFLIDTNRDSVQEAMNRVQCLVETLARERNLDGIPHPKYPGEVSKQGIGVHFGICRLTAAHQKDPTLVFGEADIELENMKIRNHRTSENG